MDDGKFTIIKIISHIKNHLKNFWNIYLVVNIVLSVGITLWLFPKSHMIMPIAFDSNVDHEELELCNKDKILQYYSSGTNYVGGKRAIKNEILPLINEKKIEFDSSNGYITIRFIVNCNGEIGLLRANEIDDDLKSTKYSQTNIDELKNVVSTLDNWEVQNLKDIKYDSYYFINFKIEEGVITDIF